MECYKLRNSMNVKLIHNLDTSKLKDKTSITIVNTETGDVINHFDNPVDAYNELDLLR